MVAENSDAPLSPELVLVAPPEEAKRAREALPEPRPPTPTPVPAAAPRVEARAPALAEVPAHPPRRRRSRLLAPGLVLALALAVGGFLVARELGDRSAPRHAAVAPAPQTGAATTAAAAASPTTATTVTTTTAPTPTAHSPTAAPVAPPPRPAASARVVSWRARPGIRHYRLDILRGGAVILTILTDAPRTTIPSSWPNAGRVRRLSRGRYEWTVRAATAGPSRLLAHGRFAVH